MTNITEHPHKNSLHRFVDKRLEKMVDRQKHAYIKEHCIDANGQHDPSLTERIDREVTRRAAMSKELDIYEPLRWAGYSFLLSAGLGAAIKATTDKKFSTPALITLVVTTALTSSIQLFRLMPRYKAALKGGLDTALAMHEFDAAHEKPDDIDVTAAPKPVRTWTDKLHTQKHQDAQPSL